MWTGRRMARLDQWRGLASTMTDVRIQLNSSNFMIVSKILFLLKKSCDGVKDS